MSGGAKGFSVDALCVGSHPDDLELTIGGTIAKMVAGGRRVTLADVTEGELGSLGSVEERREEARAAAAALGVPERTNLGLPDGGVDHTDKDQLRKAVELVRSVRPRVILVSYPSCLHPDHVETSELFTRAAFVARLARFRTGSPPHWTERVAYFMSRHAFEPSFIVDVTEHWKTKVAAISCYGSQLHKEGARGRPRTEIATPDFLDRIELRARHYGDMIGARYGEPFWMREKLSLTDPVEAPPAGSRA